jgi:hypothetical protein
MPSGTSRLRAFAAVVSIPCNRGARCPAKLRWRKGLLPRLVCSIRERGEGLDANGPSQPCVNITTADAAGQEGTGFFLKTSPGNRCGPRCAGLNCAPWVGPANPTQIVGLRAAPEQGAQAAPLRILALGDLKWIDVKPSRWSLPTLPLCRNRKPLAKCSAIHKPNPKRGFT